MNCGSDTEHEAIRLRLEAIERELAAIFETWIPRSEPVRIALLQEQKLLKQRLAEVKLNKPR